MALFGTIVDDFSSSSIAAHWDANYGTVTAIDGQARIGVDTSWQGLATSKSHTLVGSSLSAKIIPPAPPAGATECYLAFMITGSTAGTRLVIDFNRVSGWIRFGSDTAYWDETSSSVMYDPAVHVYFRMRESGGTVYFETSANGTTWTTQSTEATPAWLTTEAQAVFFETHTDVGSTYAYVDNVNTELAAPPALSPAALHLKGADGSWLTVTMRLLPWSEHVATTTTANFTESTEMIANPERGWYQYTETHWTDAAGAGYVPLDQTAAINKRTGTESIGGYTVPPRAIVFRYWVMEHMRGVDTLPQAFLDAVAADFAAARNAGVKIVGRFSYSNDGTTGANFDGNGPYNNDTTVDRTLGHVAQLKSVMSANKDVLHSLQAGFIGTWGEWYYTDYWGNKGTLTATDWNNRARLITALLDWGIDFVLLRYVGLKRRYLREASGTGWSAPRDAAARLGFHNDAFQASDDDTDWGTFNTMADGMSVSEARAYLTSETARPVPMLGETAGVSTRSGYAATKSSLAEHHWSALNPNYHADVLASWSSAEKDEVSRKLGYRLRLTSATLPSGGMPGAVAEVVLNVVNDGWGAPLSPYTMQLVFTGASTVTRDLNVDLRKLGPGSHTITQRVALPDLEGTFGLHLAIPDRRLPNRPEYAIRLANTTTWANGRNDLGKSVEVAMPAAEPVLQPATFRAASSAVKPSTDANKAIGKPFGLAEGDLMIFVLTSYGTDAANCALPSGFTQIASHARSTSHTVKIGWRVATASEPSTWTPTIPSGNSYRGDILAYENADWEKLGTPVIGTSPASSTTHAAPSITPTTDHGLLVSLVSGGGGNVWTPPTGMTERTDGQTAASHYLTLATADEQLTTASSTGTRTWGGGGGNYTQVTASLFIPSAYGVDEGGTGGGAVTLLAAAPTNGSGGQKTDQEAIGFQATQGARVSSSYHRYASHLSGDGPYPLFIHLHGDGGYEYENPNVWTSPQYMDIARSVNGIGIIPLTPDTSSGYQRWWEGYEPTYWLVDLIADLKADYNIDENRIFISGFSGGAVVTTVNLVADWPEIFGGGGAMMLGGGGAYTTGAPVPAGLQSQFYMRWHVGDSDEGYNDDGTIADDGYDAITAAQAGEAKYRADGWNTAIELIPGGIDHLESEPMGPSRLQALVDEFAADFGF